MKLFMINIHSRLTCFSLKIGVAVLYSAILPWTTAAQDDLLWNLDLQKVLEISEKDSFEAFKAENAYQISALEYQNFDVERLPTIKLELEPFTYNRSVTQRYDVNINRDVFRSIEQLNSYAGLTVSQNIRATGGNLYLNSNVNRLQNLGDNPNTAYNNNIVRLGFSQSLFQYNVFKWSKKIAPLNFQKAKKEYVESVESIHINAVNYFFAQLAAQTNKEIRSTNLKNARKLYEIGKERFKIATVNKEELLNLELNLLNSEVAVQKANEELLQSQFDLMNFLGIKDHSINLKMSDTIPKIAIEIDYALRMALENNSEMLAVKLKELNALKELDRTKSQSRFNPNFSGSIGLNKSADNYPDSFIDPLNQNRFSMKIEVPLVDWGTIKRKVEIAERTNEVLLFENKQTLELFQQRIRQQVLEFNLQNKLVESSSQAKKIAIQTHDLILERFKYGNVDIIKLNAAILAKDKAINDYINSLGDYWVSYYTLQKLILVDLKTKQNLSDELVLKSVLNKD